MGGPFQCVGFRHEMVTSTGLKRPKMEIEKKNRADEKHFRQLMSSSVLEKMVDHLNEKMYTKTVYP